MGRAAGDSNHYTWKLAGAKRADPQEIHLPSVTHIQKSIKDLLGFGGMAWWGYRIGVEDLALQKGLVKNKPVDLLDLYEDTKNESTHTPNSVRDEAGGRGTEGHDILERLALGSLQVIEADDVVYLVDEEQDEGLEEALKPTAWNLAAARWWLDNETTMNRAKYYPERSVWSLRYGYQGTLDLCREMLGDEYGPGALEIIDYKSHKPASGERKDGTYPNGGGPAYTDDLIQLQAYARAVWELGLGTVVGTRVVLLGADGKYREDTRTVPFQLFLNMKDIHDQVCIDKNCQLVARAYREG